jgi:hypothetical protein
MALYEIKMYRKPSDFVSIWVTKNNPKAAFDYGVEKGTEIFGVAPDSVQVKEDKPSEV